MANSVDSIISFEKTSFKDQVSRYGFKYLGKKFR